MNRNRYSIENCSHHQFELVFHNFLLLLPKESDGCFGIFDGRRPLCVHLCDLLDVLDLVDELHQLRVAACRAVPG